MWQNVRSSECLLSSHMGIDFKQHGDGTDLRHGGWRGRPKASKLHSCMWGNDEVPVVGMVGQVQCMLIYYQLVKLRNSFFSIYSSFKQHFKFRFAEWNWST